MTKAEVEALIIDLGINYAIGTLPNRAAAALAAQAQRESAQADEIAFLHKRRGELVIERDRYKAALGEYPEGRDVFLAAALAEVEAQAQRIEELSEGGAVDVEMRRLSDGWEQAILRAERGEAALRQAPPREPTEAMYGALARAVSWITAAPHGDNCYLCNHYEGDPGNQCNCGKDSIIEIADAALDIFRDAAPSAKEG